MRRGLRLTGVAGLAAGLAMLAVASPLGPALEHGPGQLLLFRLRGPVPPPPGVVVIAQDLESARALGLPLKLGGWPRPLLAAMIEHATAAGARAIVLDLVLDSPRDPEGDALLARVIARSGRVVLFQRMRQEAVPAGPGRPALVVEEAIPPLPAFAEGALAAAPYPLPLLGARVTAFWAFKTGAADEATLPAAALLAAVLADPAEREALARLAEARGLLEAAAAVRGERRPFERWVQQLRRAFRGAGDDPPRAAEGEGAGLAAAAMRLLAGPGSHLLAPYGPAGWLPRVAYHRVVAGDPAALAALRDRIAFVGVSDLSERVQTDSFRTVFERPDGIDPAGVEVAATACLNLLHGHAAQPLPAAASLALAGAAAALSAGGALLLPPLLAATLGLALAAAAAGAGVAALGGWQLVLPVASLIVLAIPAGLALGVLGRYGILRRHLERAVSLLTRGRVARVRLLEGLPQPGRQERRWAVCLSTDLAGYVTLTDRMRADGQGLASLVSDYRGLLESVVERHGGTVLDWSGDASMSVWLADAPDSRARARAAAAALELAAELERFARRLGLEAHHTRIGLAEGEIVLGNLTRGEHFSFGAVGEPLNVAARLEQLNKQLGTRVLATRAVVEGQNGLPVRTIGPVRLRGRSGLDEVVALEPP